MDHRYTATVAWSAPAEAHRSGRYSRAHDWRFDGGALVRGSSAPPSPGSDPAAVDPEEALVAAVSACHMMFFLAYARKHRLTVTSYEDQADGVMTPNADGKLYLSTLTLRPRITFEGEADPAVVNQVHHLAHADCYLANSIRGDVTIEPR
ncbi:OsmC family peroxiredoxin [Brevundimonas sp. S30B]|uniref:OsmC family protein n=1 Tax=unclassified Brevundimonas TaxID=2622653 RepID=UPI001072226D|nr:MULTISPECIES: OsmC family protein [unclassified Brevundimonas]QBX38557.1 OsmC family peroxiredoxin [Brevundimonas sp. MF30-B]TFW00494.1 OsmC family peroxiredoxin [Brevundimonas sp. S30B]TFW01860.1 OsmC family peroxiredoxin [Brevundimonas sp. S30B]